jgi:hypothetical protein
MEDEWDRRRKCYAQAVQFGRALVFIGGREEGKHVIQGWPNRMNRKALSLAL